MKHRFLIAFLVLTTFNQLNAQKWHQYSDSILVFFQKSDLKNTTRYLKLAEEDLKSSSIVEDTIYADFLYRKGVAYSLNNQNYNIDDLLHSRKIWQKSKFKNHFKIFKINHFIGSYYYLKSLESKEISDYKLSKEYYSDNIKYSNKHNFKNHFFHTSELYACAALEYFFFHNKRKIKYYANEYFKLISLDKAIDNIDMNYYLLNSYINDIVKQEKILKNYIIKLQQDEKSNNKLFELYVKLIHLKGAKDVFKQNSLEIIEIGEKAKQIWEKYQLPKSAEINLVLSDLVYAYMLVGDDLNYKKNKLMRAQIFPDISGKIDIQVTLDSLLKNNSDAEFKLSFNLFLNQFNSERQFESLLKMYSFSLTQFQKGKIFNVDDIRTQFNNLISLKKAIPNALVYDYDAILCVYYLIMNDFISLKSVTSKYINNNDFDIRLRFLILNTIAERFLGNIIEAKQNNEIAIKLVEDKYGLDDPRLLNLLNTSLELDLFGSDPNSIKTINRLLGIIYKHDLKDTHSSISTWIALGGKALTSYNYEDAKMYFDRANISLEKYKNLAGYEYLHYTIKMGFLRVNLGLSEFKLAKVDLDYLKEYMFNSKVYFGEKMLGEYYSMLASYFFYIDDYENANKTIDLAYEKYGNSLSRIFMIPKILSTYLLDSDYKKAISSLEKFQNEFSVGNSVTNIIYLLKYNNGTIEEAKSELIKQLNKLIEDNKISFHLLSDFQKEVVYKKFSSQFEFLNGYLLTDNSKDFIAKFIEFRFYSKALLLSNSFYQNINNLEDLEKLNRWKNNKQIIDFFLENENSNLDTLSKLKIQNREIEQLLQAKLSGKRTPKIIDLQNSLGEKDAYVEIIRINKQTRKATKKGADIINIFSDTLTYGAIIIKKNSLPTFILIDQENRLENLYGPYFKQHIQEKQKDTLSYSRLFKKIEDELSNIQKIYFVPDGYYNTINLETIFNPIKDKYLIDYLDIVPIASVRSIVESVDSASISKLKLPIVLIGSPKFKLKVSNTDISNYKDNYTDLKRSGDRIFSDLKLNYLKGAEKEIKEISMLFKKNDFEVELFEGEAATEINVKKVKSPYVFHVATHGFFINNSDTNMYSKKNLGLLFTNEMQNRRSVFSGLFLSGAQNYINGDNLDPLNNGLLTSEEVKSINLKNTELVVLSACETGLGDNIIGEGVSGLQRSFMLAGAKKIIMSFWKVNDNSTQILMLNFYENWLKHKMSISDSLKQSKLSLKINFPNPLDWGSFIILQ